MKNATNQTTIEQGLRLLAVGYPHVTLHMQPANHKIVPDAIPLGRLWDLADRDGLLGSVEELLVQARQMDGRVSSEDLTETLVQALENHYRNK